VNKDIGVIGSAINLAAVVGFAVSMLCGSTLGSYSASMCISLGYILMVGAFVASGGTERRAASVVGAVFCCMYSLLIWIVYFTQISTVRNESLDPQAMGLLTYQGFSLFFNYDLLGYCFMALSTFFIGLSFRARTGTDRALKALLLIHGVFAIAYLVLPALGLFHAGMSGGELIGTLVLEFWCAYFIPVGILSFLHFKSLEGKVEE
jgi:hypothetical protein